MKIAEMVKKIDTYNEIAGMIGQPKMVLKFCRRCAMTVTVYSLKEFRRYIRSEDIECIANAILSYDGYDFGEETEITAVDICGNVVHEEVTFMAYRAE